MMMSVIFIINMVSSLNRLCYDIYNMIQKQVYPLKFWEHQKLYAFRMQISYLIHEKNNNYKCLHDVEWVYMIHAKKCILFLKNQIDDWIYGVLWCSSKFASTHVVLSNCGTLMSVRKLHIELWAAHHQIFRYKKQKRVVVFITLKGIKFYFLISANLQL